MIIELHNEFSNRLLQLSNNPSAYHVWGRAPDIDLTSFHRYTYHRFSSCEDLFNKMNCTQNTWNIQDRKIILGMIMGHIYMDMIGGIVKGPSGINICIHSEVLKKAKGFKIKRALNPLFAISFGATWDFVDEVIEGFNELPKAELNTYTTAMFNRICEETIGKVDYDSEVRHIHKFAKKPILNESHDNYAEVYNSLIELEEKIHQSSNSLY